MSTDVANAICIAPDGTYRGTQYVLLATAGMIQNTGSVTLQTAGSTSEFVRAYGAGASQSLNNVTISPFVSVSGGAYGLHSGNGGDILISGLYTLVGSGTIYGAAAGNLGTAGTITLNDVDMTITSGSGGAGLITSTIASNVLTVNGYFKMDNSATNSNAVNVGTNATIRLYGTGSATNSITMKGAGSTSMVVNTNGTLDITNLMSITGTATNISALTVSGSGSKALLNGGITASVTGTGITASGGGLASIQGTTSLITTQNTSYGVYATGAQSKIELADTSITTSGIASHGIYAINNGAILIKGDTDITINGNASTTQETHGISVNLGGQITTANGVTLNITTQGNAVNSNRVYGILAIGATSSIQTNGTTNISALGFNNFGVRAVGGGKLTLNGDLNISSTQGTGVQSTDSGSIVKLNGLQNSINVSSGSGSISNGLLISNGEVDITSSDTSIVTTGDNAYGIQMQYNVTSVLNLGGNISISTNGINSHGFYLTSGATRTLDDTNNLSTRLPNIVVQGENSAAIAANGSNSRFTISGGARLNMGMTLGNNTWGARAEQGGSILFTGTSNTGGTALWALEGTPASGSPNAQSGSLMFTMAADAQGSHVKLDQSSTLNISNTSNTGVHIGSLESASTTSNTVLGNKTLYIGLNNTSNNGSLIDANYAGKFSNNGGSLIKQGSLTQTLSGVGNTLASVEVQAGTLSLAQNGVFTTTANYTTQQNATTNIGLNSSQLIVGGLFTQAADATLQVTLGASPDIIASSASLDGILRINGFNATEPARATDISRQDSYYTLLRTTTGTIAGDFTNPRVGMSGLDYLLESGYVSSDQKEYRIGFALAWTDGKQAESTGTFTINDGTAFDLDIQLSNQTIPTLGFDTGWDGKSLVKQGEGVLIVSTAQAYDGNTTLNLGKLQTNANDVFSQSNQLTVNGGILDVQNTDQLVHRLSGNGGTIQLTDSSSSLTVNNAIAMTDDTLFKGNTTGSGTLTKLGDGRLTLTGDLTHTGETTISGGELSIGDGGTSGSIVSHINNNGILTFNRSDASNYSGILRGSGDLLKKGTGTLTIDTTSSIEQGSVDVIEGTLKLAENNPLTLTTSFTTAGNYVTRSGATTDLGTNNSVLDIRGTFTQEANSTLKIELGAWLIGQRAEIVATGNVFLDGTLEVTGFTLSSTPNRASELIQSGYKVIESTSGVISGSYVDDKLIGAGSSGLDYLLINSEIRENNTEFWLGFLLNWDQGKAALGSGNFTIDTGGFTLDTVLEDQAIPGSGFASGWDGKSLTKNGLGTLRLDAEHTYTGKTTINNGTLQALTGSNNAFKQSSDIIVNEGATLDVNGTQQIAQHLSSTSLVGGTVSLNGGKLTIDNHRDDTVFSGTIQDGNLMAGEIIKTGSNKLTLSGSTLWTGKTWIKEGTLTLDGYQGDNYANLTSDIIGENGSALELLNGASLTGSVDPLNLSIDSTSRWNMTGNSEVNDLTLGGTLSITPPQGGFKQLTVKGNYTGQDGSIVFNGALAGDNSPIDRMTIEGDAVGSTHVEVTNMGGRGARTLNGIELIQVQGRSDAEFIQTGRIVAGAYDYTLARGTDSHSANNWYLTSKLSSPIPGPNPPPGPGPGPDPKPKPDPGLEIRRPEGGTYVANAAAAASLFAMQWDHHNQHQKYVDGETGLEKSSNVWFRIEGARSRSYDDSNQLKMTNHRTVFQVGADMLQWTTPTGTPSTTTAGVMGGYGSQRNTTDASLSAYTSTGEVSGYHLGAYATWQQNLQTQEGGYVDTWVYYSWLDNDVNGEGLSPEHYESKGLTASVETGYTVPLGQGKDITNYYLQPQAQITWMGTRADEHIEHNGTRIGITGENNIQTRLGLKAFSKIEADTRASFEANWIHNSKLSGVSLDDLTVNQNGNRHLAELKAGVQGVVNKRVHVSGNVAHRMGNYNYRESTLSLEIKAQF